ncbi:TetR family transcriptional regulator [Tamaricihabitans halophyticus]|uniref:TetR family transcriptional regulator n=1 Tax=Tamaricihabitans halophyticus TaxID=1262583 RepID=A0A4R2Q7C3_9PSEU|nr:TetR family transcriptional regulator [Tamaricihabitans halophyticus]
MLNELAEVGYQKLTMDGVAKRAGSSKPTLYRRWSSKEEMVIAAVATVSQPVIPEDDGRDLWDRLLELTRAVHVWLSDPLVHRIMPDLLAEGLRSDALDRAHTHYITEPRREASKATMATARERGEIRQDINIEFVLDVLAAPIYWRLCVLRKEVDDDYLQTLTDFVHRELTTRDV